MAGERYDFDAAIVGGGPAGLSAALVLGRCRRRVVVFDHGRPRNRRAAAVHGFLGHDGIDPRDLRALGRREAAFYGVVFVDREATAVRCLPGDVTTFEVSAEGTVVRVRKLLLATGVSDTVPQIGNIEAFYGTSVHHCPYCDGWEHRDQRLVAFGEGSAAIGLALLLKVWSKSVTACTHGGSCAVQDLQRLNGCGIPCRTEPVIRLEGDGGILQQIVFAEGPPLACDALFFHSDHFQHSPLPAMAGCRMKDDAHVHTSPKQSTGVRGLYLAGDADGDVQFAIVAAAEGATAATAINKELVEEDSTA